MHFRLILAGLVLLNAAAARAATILVDSRTVIFAADGNGSPDDAGLVPVTIELPAGFGRILQVSQVTGIVSPAGAGFAFPPDGGNFLNVSPRVFAYIGIAGIADGGTENVLALLGVFTAGPPIPGERPADRNVTTEKDLPVVTTILNQPFFIGDGQWSGGMQQFPVPDGATGFSFGFADAIPQQGIYQGPPGAYGDNTGSLTATYTIVPEPGAPALMLFLAAFAAGNRRRSGRSGRLRSR